jgi:hypothetical protein
LSQQQEEREESSGGLPTAAEVRETGVRGLSVDAKNVGDELVRRADVKELIQERLEKAEEKVEKYNSLDSLNLNDAKARKQELEELLQEVQASK